MRIAVVGGAGGIGRVTVEDAASNDDVEWVRVVDLNVEGAEAVKRYLGSNRVCVKESPLDGDFAEAIAGANVVVNAASHRLNLAVMRACLDVGANYVDLGGLFHFALRQVELEDAFKAAGLTAAISVGTAPGITNMLAAACCERLTTVDAIELVDALIDLDGSADAPYVPAYAPDTLIDEFTEPAPMLIDGEFEAMPAGSGSKVYRLPEGDVECIYTIHSEPATLARSYADRGIRRIEWRLGLPVADMQRLRSFVLSGLTGTEPVQVGNTWVRPRDVLIRTLERQRELQADASPNWVERLRAYVRGVHNGENVELMADLGITRQPGWRFDAGTWATGVAPSVAAQIIGRGEALAHGVGGPEVMLPIDGFFAELALRGIGPPQVLRVDLAGGELLAPPG
jgi:saccharopine dehydrogenase-like NADP-dependent oxidoreductase